MKDWNRAKTYPGLSSMHSVQSAFADKLMAQHRAYALEIGCEIVFGDEIVCTREQMALLDAWWSVNLPGEVE